MAQPGYRSARQPFGPPDDWAIWRLAVSLGGNFGVRSTPKADAHGLPSAPLAGGAKTSIPCAVS